jgi:plasmid stabilization system protein ParE
VDFKLIWSDSSIEDLGAIVRFIAVRDGSQIARQIGFGIYERAQILTRHPEAGSVLSEKQDSRWRKLIFKSWKIAYRLDQEAKVVYVVRVWHAARNEIDIQ